MKGALGQAEVVVFNGHSEHFKANGFRVLLTGRADLLFQTLQAHAQCHAQVSTPGEQ